MNDREIMQMPVLQDIEQYRMQMASISTAAVGYWKEGDGIHPDYDTPALRDVAMLYAKYDALYKAQPEQKPVAGVVIREGLPTLLQDKHIKSTDQRLYTAPQKREWQGLTNEEVGALTVFDGLHHVEIPILANFVWAVEAKLKEKND